MPVIVLEARDFTSPLFCVRTLALLFGCVTFSLVASLESSELQQGHTTNTTTSPQPQRLATTFKVSCMFTWCFFFILTFLIHVLHIIQFHSLIPISWKNLTVTVAALGALMCLSACIFFPWLVMDHQHISPLSRPVAAAVFSCLTCLAYSSEAYVIRTQAHEQRGYMASAPGLLKVLQFWGGCQMIPLLLEGVYGASIGENGAIPHWWQLWLSGVSYNVCLLMSLGTLVVILGDCTARCPLRFDRVLAGFSVFGVLLYMVASVICFTKVLEFRKPGHYLWNDTSKLVVMETVVASITLIAYTVDLAISIKLLCDRSHA